MSGRSPSVLRSTIANWAVFVVVAVVSFLLSPFIIHRLGDSAYGTWVLLGSFVGYLGLLDFGVRGAVTRYVANQHAAGDHQGASVTVRAALRLFAGLAIVTAVIAGLLALWLDNLFGIPPNLLDAARLVVLLGGASVAVSFVGGVFGGIVAGLHRFDLDGAVEITITLLRAAAVVAALRAGYGLVTLALIQFVVSVLRSTVAFVLARRLYPELSLRSDVSTRQATKQLLAFSLFSSLIQLSGILIYYSNSIVIAAFLPIGFVTYYAIASNLADYARQVVAAISRVITPRTSAALATGGIDAVRRVVLSVGPTATLVTAPMAITFLLRGERFLDLWMGPAYGQATDQVLMILSLPVWLAGGRLVAAAAAIGINRHQGLAVAVAWEALANLGLSILLIKPLALPGVALGMTIPTMIVNLVFMPSYCARHLRIPAWDFVTRVWVLPSAACAVFAIATYAVERWTPADSLVVFFLQVALLLPLVGLGAAFTLFTRTEREQLVGRAGRAWDTTRGFARSAMARILPGDRPIV
ncbi:MAG TPA: oligosaccharide flippase family protein [Gemmatimonadales bacterium]|jgi:O-antigen/teichoic acid export membrane protein|nr:oligosaccharide flippase family protein [Gemmatimonadales bacterium]